MDPEIISELKGRKILHWNFRGLRELPIELKYHGEQVEEMYLKLNNFITLPAWIKDLKLLTNLYLYGNGLEYLPEEIGELTLLNTLSLENNQLRTLPKSLWQLKNLNYLNLELNHRENLPPDICFLKALYVLNMKGNCLRSIPAAIGTMNSLQELILDCNHLKHLPQNIVYLPNINYFSVSSNHLVYLPSVWFINNPKVNLRNNPYLNYISYEWGCALTKKENLSISGDIWYFNMSGCFTENIDPEEFWSHLMIQIDDKPFVMPPFIKSVSSVSAHSATSLYELALRKVYNYLFSTKDIRQCRNQEVLQMLPQEIQQLLWSGPTAHCCYCKRPLFTEYLLWVALKYVLNNNEIMPNRIPAFLYFCNNKCCIFFTDNELKNNEFDNITNRIEWTQYKCII